MIRHQLFRLRKTEWKGCLLLFLLKDQFLYSAEDSGWLNTFLVGLSASPVLIKTVVFWSSFIWAVCKRSPNASLRIDYPCLFLMKINNVGGSRVFLITRPLKLKIKETFPKPLRHHFLPARFTTTWWLKGHTLLWRTIVLLQGRENKN